MTGLPPGSFRHAWAEVDLDAVRHNARTLLERAGGAQLCAVVKADAYGHGAVPVARAALEGGATWLGVALVEEGAALRDAGIEAPILLLSEPPPEAMGEVVAHRLRPTLYTHEGLQALASAAAGADEPVPVHLKVDTGMHRVGAPVERSVELALDVVAAAQLRLEGLWTHFAVADEPERTDHTERQLRRFDEAVATLEAKGVRPPLLHTCNSAGTLAHPAGHHQVVRCGIALYGVAPSPQLAAAADGLRPALSLHARVSYVKELAAGEAMSYGLHYTLERDSVVATVPLGYADGVPRRLSFVGGQFLVGGVRRPIAGAVTMDQLLVDCGPGARVEPGDPVVLLGRQGQEVITADEWAAALGTISYEVLCGIGPRVPRVHVGGER